MDDIFIRVRGGGSIAVPRSPKLLTTYVLLEKEDWFEKEIGFVRRLLRPGMRAIDIGANYGVYTLAIANSVGANGAVWAYEPASATALALGKTLARNALSQVEFRQAALSDCVGTAHLRLDTDCELNSLSHSEVEGRHEQVPVTTLDHEQKRLGWEGIDFVKLDAEGEENRIISGGERFFSSHSPLVMFEVVAGTKVNHGLPDAFVERGYHLFHLVGPNTLLVPFEIGQPFDTFEINLFACKPDRARLLAEAGLLTTRRVMPPNVAPGSGIDLWRQMPCAGAAAHSQSNEPALSRAMDLYALWRSTTCDPAERYGALLASVDLLKSLVGKPGGFAIASTLARVAFEAGSRAFALELVAQMLSGMKTGRPVLDHPFWPTEARFDHVAPGGDLQVWFLAGLAEAFERWRKPTSYFGGPRRWA
jgi:FkbM family methyltransferase